MAEAKEAFHHLLSQWIEMCATTPEFVAQYNRLNKSNACFDLRDQSPIVAMVGKACGLTVADRLDTKDNREFIRHAVDLFLRMNGLPVPEMKRG